MIKQILQRLGIVFVSIVLGAYAPVTTYASGTPILTQVIGSGTLSVDIVNLSFVSVTNPGVSMGGVTFRFDCQTATGTLGTAAEQISVQNPDVADAGWVVSLAVSDPEDLWTSDSGTYDFNDPTNSGCTNGQMTIDPSAATLAKGQCTSCDTNDITLGTFASFVQGTADSITILTGAADSSDTGDWTLQGVTISQKIPAEKPADSYSIEIVLSVIALGTP